MPTVGARFSEQVSLGGIDAEVAECFKIVVALESFGDDSHVEVECEEDERADGDASCVVVSHAVDEVSVDLDKVGTQFHDVPQWRNPRRRRRQRPEVRPVEAV